MKRLIALAALAVSLCLPISGVFASEINEAATAADPVAEKRLQGLSEELRCLVCQNQTIADSHADLAQDLRNQVRDMLRQGKSEAEILAYMTQRYGDFVLYRPPVKPLTWLLWFGPALLLVLAGLGLWRMVRNNRTQTTPVELTPAQKEQARALLESDPPRP